HRIPLAGCAEIAPGAILGVASAPLLRVPLDHATLPPPVATSAAPHLSPVRVNVVHDRSEASS
ncbi:unnamed protein product, partial [Pylaiella littoralis]